MGRAIRDTRDLAPPRARQLTGEVGIQRRTGATIPAVLDGTTLEALLGAYRARGETMPVRDAVHHIQKACDAIQELHAARRVHGDIKPANLLLRRSGGGEPHIVVLDSGVTSLVDQRGRQRRTIGLTIGSPAYMSPEQLLAPGEDARTDIWSLGVVFYELLTNELPFSSQRTSEIASLVLRRTPVPPGRLRAGIPGALDGIVLRCLEKYPERRFQSARELARALRDELAS